MTSRLTEEDKAFFHENGYIVVRNAVPKADCDAVIDAIWEFLGMDRNNPEDWYREPLHPGGMIEMYQHQAMWNNRQNPTLYQVFTELFETPALSVTIDRVNFKPPRHPDHPEFDHKGFIHWDVDPTQPRTRLGVQGVLYLADTDIDQGGFQCVPALYRNLPAYLESHPNPPNVRVPDMEGQTLVPIPGKAGDFVIWNCLLAHGNGHNVSQKPRFAQFISMSPAEYLTEEAREHRVRCWQERQPPGNKIFPGDPREIEQKYGRTAELTALGRKLLGVDAWD